MTKAQEIRERLSETNPEALLADGYDGALIGITNDNFRTGSPVAVYDTNEVISIIIERDGCDWDEAIEWMEFNIIGSWNGENTPLFIELM